jgi:hypothetical protein
VSRAQRLTFLAIAAVIELEDAGEQIAQLRVDPR